jgi:anthranilate phosphoribosyltransferase
MVRRVRNGRVEAFEWTPADFGLKPTRAADLQADGPAGSADILRRVLAGQAGPARGIVCANAAAALLVTGHADNLMAGVHLAERAIDTGAARRILDGLCRSPDGPTS